MDDQYQVYINRLMGMTRLDHYRSQWSLVQPSPKFEVLPEGEAKPNFFPGYTLITPPGLEDSGNVEFFKHLDTVKQEFWAGLPEGSLASLPLETFHITIADLIWDSNYQQKIDNDPEYDTKLRAEIADLFQQQPATGKSIGLKVLGFIIMTRALAVCLAPNTEADYQAIVDLRRLLYQRPSMLGLGIDQRYHFTGHITLGYFTGKENIALDTEGLSERLDRLNDVFLGDFPEFQLQTVELRKFDNMVQFYRQPDWPVWSF